MALTQHRHQLGRKIRGALYFRKASGRTLFFLPVSCLELKCDSSPSHDFFTASLLLSFSSLVTSSLEIRVHAWLDFERTGLIIRQRFSLVWFHKRELEPQHSGNLDVSRGPVWTWSQIPKARETPACRLRR